MTVQIEIVRVWNGPPAVVAVVEAKRVESGR
jgi:hypothetical protein